MTSSRVTAGIATCDDAARHFTARLRYETDCADVHAELGVDPAPFVLVDARGAEAHAAGHVPGAISLPHASITADTTAHFATDTVFVTYCWGPHCNGATRAAARLARLGFRVKEMIGGVSGWEAEGFTLTSATLRR